MAKLNSSEPLNKTIYSEFYLQEITTIYHFGSEGYHKHLQQEARRKRIEKYLKCIINNSQTLVQDNVVNIIIQQCLKILQQKTSYLYMLAVWYTKYTKKWEKKAGWCTAWNLGDPGKPFTYLTIRQQTPMTAVNLLNDSKIFN